MRGDKVNWNALEDRLRTILERWEQQGEEPTSSAEALLRIDSAIAAYTKRGNALSDSVRDSACGHDRQNSIDSAEWDLAMRRRVSA